MQQQTAMRQLVEHKLGRDLATYVRVRQAEGLGWRRIAADLTRDTGQPISHETLRSWFAGDVAA
jgi:hypothetical protein